MCDLGEITCPFIISVFSSVKQGNTFLVGMFWRLVMVYVNHVTQAWHSIVIIFTFPKPAVCDLNMCYLDCLLWFSLAWTTTCSVVSDSLQPHGLYSLWNSPGQNTGVGSHSLLQEIFPTQVSHIAGGFFTSWATREALNNHSWTQTLE